MLRSSRLLRLHDTAAAGPPRRRGSLARAVGLAATLGVAVALAGSVDVAAAAGTAPSPAASSPSPTTPISTTPVLPTPTPTPTPPADLDEADTPDGSLRPTRAVSYAARLVVPVVARSKPSNRGRKVTALRPYGSWNGGPVVLQIVEAKQVKDTTWLRVRLPIRPNGSTGWVKRSSVDIERLRYRILVSRRAHRLTLLRDGRKVGSTRIVVGAPGTPTPRGSFAVLETVRQPRGAVIGPWALHLTAHSNVLENYGGGPGRVALHGRSGALLNDPLGSSRSHGCIRMPNAFVTKLARVATEGTPVVIT